MSETTDTYRTQLREVNEELDLLRTLHDHKLFKKQLTWLQDQVDTLRNNYELIEPGGLDGLINKEFLRGQISGLRIATECFEGRKEELEDAADVLKKALSETIKEEE